MRLLRTLAPLACVLAVVVTRPAPFAALSAGVEKGLHRTLGEEHILCRLYLDPHDKFTRVGPPVQSSLLQTGAIESDANLSTINVNYTGFTGTNGTLAQNAFQAAVNIWKTQVASTVPIVVDATFENLGTGGLLGSAGSGATADFSPSARANTFYPFPLANKIAGSDVGAQFSPTTSNITAHFNNDASVNWYFGTDGLTPSGKVDFESVVLHELGHGLGFFGGADASSAQGSLGNGGTLYIYDTFAADALSGGNLLSNTVAYPNPGTALSTALKSGNVFWDGPSGKSANGNARPKLYAPAIFSSGSTFSHLDETTYTAGNINSLMTPAISTAESIHTAGPIMMGMFADMGWGSQAGGSCNFGLDNTSATVAAVGVSGSTALSVTVSTGPSCAWTASTASSFATITSGASGTGSGVVRIAVAANSGGGRAATVTIAGNTFTIAQNGTGPSMSLDKTSFIFSGVSNGASFTSQTGTQTARMTQTGTGTVTWTASSSVPWLTVSPASGGGSATLSLSVGFTGGLAATQTGAITITLTGAGNTAGPINVTLNLISSGAAAVPVGSFDTPIDNSTGVTGSLAVTGWAMDDVQVSGVRILRTALAGEPPSTTIGSTPVVFIGNAVLVDGARPDVAALFPNSPRNSFAGWGYLMLTNFLPSTGNGTFVLWAVADDADGHSTVLGSKTITCTNSSATAPFGAIDTPAQGGTVTGNMVNFGWVLGPNPRRADPPGGGTVRMVIDGAIVSTVPGGWTNRSDLTSLFAAAQFPGISTALGAATFDTTSLTNGVHTISWLVTDNLGSASGIGSRYFTVSNGSLTLDPAQGNITRSARVIAGSLALSTPRAAALRFNTVAELADEVAGTPVDTRAFTGRRGYHADAPFGSYTFRNGVATIQSEELDRIELHLAAGGGHSYAGYLRTSTGLAPLPIGSALNASTGGFTWQPGVGFVGTYDLVFVRWAGSRAVARQDVRVVLNPKGSNRVGPQVVIDTPRPQQDVAQPFVIAGWAADLDSAVDVGVDAVHVWAYPLRGGDPIFLGAAAMGGARPDVAALYGDRFAKTGYGLTLRGLEPGNYDIAVFAYSTVTGGFVPAKTVRLTVR